MYSCWHIYTTCIVRRLKCVVDALDSLTATNSVCVCVCRLMQALYECENVRVCSVRTFTHELSRRDCARQEVMCFLNFILFYFIFFTKWRLAVNI